ncbi:streptophobe family protein [Actinacidiphila sp. ITFR-21]|uniref:streptophobe family protein n=1 Tax=Actinacidiphila sp. ITFR-21 TaxID=3075199 RepID=UPI0028894452|nr:streptophobe family protein [Streptomyces sp. ITFR-21]WNI14941.1 streptophobe family protein [Streptomyces sp. ITFR-21]
MSARSTPWAGVLFSSLAAVSWAFAAMAGVAALGLHLLGADASASLGPMTAAVVAMAVGGKVRPTGDIGVFGLTGSQTQAAIGITPLGVSLVGALFLVWVFLRSLRRAGPLVTPAELAARVATTAALFLALVGGLAWAGQDTVAIDAGSVGPSSGTAGDLLGGLPGIGDIGGGLTDGLQDIVKADTSVKFHVETGRSLLGALVWVLVVLLIALLASRRTPLPAGWQALHRVVRPAVSAITAVLLTAVLAGFAAAVFAAATGDQPGRIMGAALLGTPNGVWLAVPLGLFVPWKGTASGPLASLLPDPVGRFVAGHGGATITPGALADLDGRVWLLPLAAALMMLLAGALTATRTPPEATRGRFVAACALRLGVATALALPLLVGLTGVTVNANLSVFGFDAVGAGIDLRGNATLAFLLGALWGAAAGAAGAFLALATGAAGRRPAALAVPGPAPVPADTPPSPAGPPGPAPRPAPPAPPGPVADDAGRTYPALAYRPGPYQPSTPYRPDQGPNPYQEPHPYADPSPAKDKEWPPPPPRPPS